MDQVEAIGARLSPDMRTEIDEEITRVIADAVRFAEASEWPHPEDLFTHVYA
jgi:TPP-dependent pyruvate/acetoin dehydrogenase alpha subunit